MNLKNNQLLATYFIKEAESKRHDAPNGKLTLTIKHIGGTMTLVASHEKLDFRILPFMKLANPSLNERCREIASYNQRYKGLYPNAHKAENQ